MAVALGTEGWVRIAPLVQRATVPVDENDICYYFVGCPDRSYRRVQNDTRNSRDWGYRSHGCWGGKNIKRRKKKSETRTVAAESGGLLTTRFEHPCGGRPEARHVEPVGRVGGGDEVDTTVLDRWSDIGAQLFGRRYIEADVVVGPGGGGGCERASSSDHALGRVETDGLREVWCQCPCCVSRAAANVQEGMEMAAGRDMVVEDGLVDFWVVVAPDLGVLLTLTGVIGAECLLLRCWLGRMLRCCHGGCRAKEYNVLGKLTFGEEKVGK